MPLTPFHMGPGLLFKSLGRRRFSLIVFGVSQVAIDIEPLVRMLRGDTLLHGFTHTLPGAIVVGACAAVVGRPVAMWFLGVVRREGDAAMVTWSGDVVSWPIALSSALIGTGSHLLLDGIMHGDMRPFWPLFNPNPLLGVIGLSALHLLCVVSGLAGFALLLVSSVVARKRPV